MVQSDGDSSRPRNNLNSEPGTYETLHNLRLSLEIWSFCQQKSVIWYAKSAIRERMKEYLPNIHNVVHMVAQCHEKVKEKLTAILHFCLHGSAPLKCLATSDDQGEIMSAEP